VKFLEDAQQCTMNFAVSARGGLYVQRVDAGRRLRSEVRGKERISVVEMMRSKIAGIVLEKTLRGEVILAKCSYVAHRDNGLASENIPAG